MLRFVVAAVVALGGLAPGTPTRVLFIGNSLTTVNDVPGLLEALAGRDAIETRTVAFNDYSLQDHWARGDAQKAIAAGGWNVVVLQQGPSALPESRVLLIEYARRFDAEARKVGAKTAMYMVWPSSTRIGDFDGVSASYAAAAREVGGLLLPVGDAWRAAWRRDPRLALYGADGFHPTPLGSYLAALVMYQQLTGRSPAGLPTTVRPSVPGMPPIVVPVREALLLQQAAQEANARAGVR
jgi:hypothetical protein